jgi:glyoxylase-like metal-dependent hydrolase (beta-lactamase superfamily II)
MIAKGNLLFAAGFSLVAAASPPVFATDGRPLTATYEQVADSFSLPLGNLQVTALSDGTVPQDLHKLLSGTSRAHTDKLLFDEFLKNPVEASINAFLIQSGERTILVDTGSGDLIGPGNGGKLLDSLLGVGVKASDVTDILITHIHTDHSGGLIRNGQPAFPNATVYVSEADLKFFLDASNAQKTGYPDQYFDEAAKTIGVYKKMGRVKSFHEGEQILPGITAALHPGHTPGSAFFTVHSQERSMTFIGDSIHVAAIQFAEPTVTIVYDVKPEDAAAVRNKTFPNLAKHRELVAAPHLPFPGIGYIRAKGEGSFSWHPMEYRNRAGQ